MYRFTFKNNQPTQKVDINELASRKYLLNAGKLFIIFDKVYFHKGIENMEKVRIDIKYKGGEKDIIPIVSSLYFGGFQDPKHKSENKAISLKQAKIKVDVDCLWVEISAKSDTFIDEKGEEKAIEFYIDLDFDIISSAEIAAF